MIFRKFLSIHLILLVIIGCFLHSNPALCKTNIRLMAAASLKESFNEIISNFNKSNLDIKIEVNYAGSPQIVTQIENGMNCDIVALASKNAIRPLVKYKLVDTPENFAKNSLIVAISPYSKDISSLKDLIKNHVKIAIGIKTLPAGEYAYKILEKIDELGIISTNYSKKILQNVVTNELDVKSIVNKVELGEVDAGFVYKTDVINKKKSRIKILFFPKSVSITATYPIAIVSSSQHKKESQKFKNYLLSANGQKILSKFGFIIIAK